MQGWFKIHRNLSDNAFWLCEKFTRGQAWIDLIMLANHKDGFFYLRGVKITIERGQVGWSAVKLAERWKWSRSKVNKFLNDLEKEQQIKQLKNNVSLVVTLINYEKYQAKEQQTLQQKSSRRAAEEQQKDTNKNDKNDKNDKNLFIVFWNQYHSISKKQKTDKEATLKYWKKLKESEQKKAIDEIQNYCDSVKNKKYLKKARTYLSDKNFNDEFGNQINGFTHVSYQIKGYEKACIPISDYENRVKKLLQHSVFQVEPKYITK